MTGEEAYWAGLGPEDCEPDATAPPTNAELLRLLERHHAVLIADDDLGPRGEQLYIGTELYWKTVAALKPTTDPVAFTRERYGKTLRDLAAHDAEGATMKDAHGLGDPLRTRVPVWRCPDCKMKFYSPEEYEAHKKEESALKDRV